MHEQEGTIQQFAAAKCPKTDILLQQIAESYLLAHTSLSKWTRPGCRCLVYWASVWFEYKEQGLKYNFQGGGTVQLSGPLSSFISWALVSIAGFQIINDRLNVLSMISYFFQFCEILWKLSTLWIYDRKNVKFEWLTNYRITIAKVASVYWVLMWA